MILDPPALEVLDGINLLIRQHLLNLIADWKAKRRHAANLVPELQKTIADSMLGFAEVAPVWLADEEVLGWECDPFGKLGAQAATLNRVGCAGKLGPIFKPSAL